MLPVVTLELRREHNNYLKARGSEGKMIEFRARPSDLQPLIKRLRLNVQQLGDGHFVDAFGQVAIDLVGVLVQLEILGAPPFLKKWQITLIT